MITRTYKITNLEPVLFVTLKGQYYQSTKEHGKRLRLSPANFQKLQSAVQGSTIYSMKLQEDASLNDTTAAIDNVA